MKLYQYSIEYTIEQIQQFEVELISLKANLLGLVCAEKRKSVFKTLSQWEKFLLHRDWERIGIWPNRVITLSEKQGWNDVMAGKPIHPYYIPVEGGVSTNIIGVSVLNWDEYFKGWRKAWKEKYGEEYSPREYFRYRDN